MFFKKKKKPKSVGMQKYYFNPMKIIFLIWMLSGLILTIAYSFKNHPLIPKKVSYFLYSDLEDKKNKR